MNYQELRDFALHCSLEHFLCEIEELSKDKTPDEILEMVENGDESIVLWEPFEHHDCDSIASAIEDLRGVNVWNFMHVLTQINGAEWAINFKGQE